jgi:lipopolysaccharide/colanic/teichoic acid biosynthesis glycosyltransferase
VNGYLDSRRKRALDVLGALAALIVSAPVLAAAAIAIRIEGDGHFIFRQRRVGRFGEPFELFKLRTMVAGAETMGAGLAELPNLINVLRGEMSLVGPRPTVQVQVDRYTEEQRHRLDTRPGITGWAQINGRASLPWHERIELDLVYLDQASLRHDLRILALSVRMVVTGHGLYRGETGGWREPPRA